MTSDEQLRQIIQFSKSAPIEPLEAASHVEKHFAITLPATLKRIHRLGGGSSVKVYVDEEWSGCDLHALVTNPFEHYGTDILTAHERLLAQLDQCRAAFRRVIPFAQDGAGAQFCLDYRTQEDPLVAKCDWDYQLLARSFDEFLTHALPEKRPLWTLPPNAISEHEHQQFLSLLPEYW